MSRLHLRAAYAAAVLWVLVAVILPTAGQSHNPQDESALLVPKQEIEAFLEDADYRSWRLEVTTGFPEVQCAHRSVTATFVLNTPFPFEEVIDVYSTGLNARDWMFYKDYKVMEVVLAPREGVACQSESPASLVVKLACHRCSEFTSTVTFSTAPTFAEMGNQYFEVTNILVGSTPPIWKFTVPVHPGILRREKGSLFTAVFVVPLSSRGRFPDFWVRFRGPLNTKNAWITEKKDDQYRVYAALEVPTHWFNREPPTITIDLVCKYCNVKHALLSYAPARSEWKDLKNGTFMDNYSLVRENRSKVEFRKSLQQQQCKNKPNCYEYESAISSLCSGQYDGFALVVIPSVRNVEFFWESNNTTHEAVVIRNGLNYFVRWVPAHGGHPCDALDADIRLVVMSEIKPFGVTWYFAAGPWVQPGMRLVHQGFLTGWWMDDGRCRIDRARAHFGNLMKMDVVRIWYPWLLHRRQKEAFVYNKVLRTWERELAGNLTSELVYLSGGTRYLCIGALVQVFHYLDARLDASDRGSTAVSIQKTLPNVTQGKNESPYVVFDGVVPKNRMAGAVPFLVTLCLTGRTTRSVKTVEFGNEVLMPVKVSVGAEVVECYALDSCQAWKTGDDMNFNYNHLIPRFRITGDATIPSTLRWRLEDAKQLEDNVVENSKRTEVSRAGWYGTVEQALNYTIPAGVISRHITLDDRPLCGFPVNLSEFSNVEKALYGSKARSVTGDRVYLVPPFQVHPIISLYSGDWRGVQMKVLFLAVSLAVMVQTYHAESPLLL